LGRRRHTGIFLVEDVKRRQAHVGDFLLAKKDFVALCSRRCIALASPVEAHAPLAIESDTPAKPSAGKALPRRLVFEERFDMAQFSHLLEAGSPIAHTATRSA
jgi:hypothetical protein